VGGGDAILVLVSTSNRTDLNCKPILCLHQGKVLCGGNRNERGGCEFHIQDYIT